MPKIKYHKPINLYTHPAITEYEFLRMNSVWTMAKVIIIFMSIPCLVISGFCIYALLLPIPKVKEEVKDIKKSSPPIWQPEYGAMVDLSPVVYTKKVE